MKVFLNPGHAPGGHPDPGAVNSESGLRECDVALAVGQSAESYLNAAGVATELLQSDSLEEICEASNASDADIFVSIHCNAAEAEEANGTETWACAGSYRGSMLAFITNPDDEEILANAQDALARAVARGITDYEQLILGGK